MQILPDGRVSIKNFLTKEERVVNPEDLPQYGISMDTYNSLKSAYKPSVEEQMDEVRLKEAIYDLNKKTAGSGAYTPGIAPTNPTVTPSPLNNPTKPPLSSMVYKTDTQTGKSTNNKNKSFTEQLSEIERLRQQDLIWYPDNKEQINSYYDSKAKELDPTGTKAEAEKKAVTTDTPLTEKQKNEVQDTVSNIDTVLGKDLSFVGTFGSIRSKIPGTDSYDTARQIQQIKDQLSLASVGKLKGQGQVSDAERLMLANASTALDVGMTEKAFREELGKVKKILNRSIGVQTNITSQQNKPQQNNMSGGFIQDKFMPKSNIQLPNIGFGKDNSEEAYKYLQQSSQTAKDAIKEQDKTKKNALIAKSRTLSDVGSDMSRTQKINPLIYGAGKTQEYLANSEALPAIGGTVGSVRGAVGSGAGAGAGQYMKIALQKGANPEPLTLPEAGSIALKAGEYALLNKIFTGGGKYMKDAWEAKTLNPSKISLFLREKAAENAPTINTTNIIKAGDRWAKLDPQSAEAWNELKAGLSPKMPTKDLLDQLTAWGGRTWTMSGVQKDKAASELMKKIYAAGRHEIFEQAPEVAKHTAELRNLAGLPKMIQAGQKASWLLLKLLGIAKLGGL